MPRKRRRRKNKQPNNVISIKTASGKQQGTIKNPPAYTKSEKYDPLDNGTWTTGVGYTGGRGFRCDQRHWKQPIEIAEGIVIRCSAWYDRPLQVRWDYPKVGLYFDNAWLGDRSFVSRGWHGPNIAHRGEFAVIGWPDYDIPNQFAKAVEALEYALNKAGDGIEVEIGCLGGHGRTGTALASMLVLLGEEPDDAMHWVWKNYCDRAIETPDQERWVDRVYAHHNGIEYKTNQLLLPTNDSVYTSAQDESAMVQKWLKEHVDLPEDATKIPDTDLYESKQGVYWWSEGQSRWLNLTEDGTDPVLVEKIIESQTDKLLTQSDDKFLDELGKDHAKAAHADANHVNGWCMVCDHHADYCYCAYGVWD
jgi:hypothetical protein